MMNLFCKIDVFYNFHYEKKKKKIKKKKIV